MKRPFFPLVAMMVAAAANRMFGSLPGAPGEAPPQRDPVFAGLRHRGQPPAKGILGHTLTQPWKAKARTGESRRQAIKSRKAHNRAVKAANLES